MAKLDLQAAFRIVPILPSEWEMLGMRWRDCNIMLTPYYPLAYVLLQQLCQCPPLVPGAQLWSHTLLEHNYGATPSCTTWTPPYSNYGCPWPSCKKSPLSPNLGWARDLLLRGNSCLSLASSPLLPRWSQQATSSCNCLIHLSITARRLHHRTRLNANARADVVHLPG